jgi:hypothetical protein
VVARPVSARATPRPTRAAPATNCPTRSTAVTAPASRAVRRPVDVPRSADRRSGARTAHRLVERAAVEPVRAADHHP